jgi:hypothetical protein
MHVRANLLILAAVLSALVLAGCAAEDASSSPGPSSTAASKPGPRTKTTYKTVRVKKPIPFSRDTVKTSSLDKGETSIDQQGRPGVRVRVVRVAIKNGVEVGREVVRTFVNREPNTQVKLVGTHVDPKPKPAASNCDSNYAGACVPIASDVDCAGGSGDGPAYVQGPVRVVGDDHYDLNRDSDDIACDS